MPRLEITGIDELMAGLNQQGGAMHSRIVRALELSADALQQALVAEEKGSFKEPTGELGETLASDQVVNGASASWVEVYARGSYKGKRGKPRRAGLVAGMVEYKHNNPWNRRARSKSKKRINSIIAQELGQGSGSVGAGFGGL